MKRQQGKVHTIATKVTADAKAKLFSIAERMGFSFYELFQAFALVCLRLCDAPSSLSDEHRQMLAAFMESVGAMDGGFNLLKISGRDRWRVRRALLFVEATPATRPQLLSVSKERDGLVEDYNQDTMLADFLSATAPYLLAELRRESKRRKLPSLFQTLRDVIMENKGTPDDRMAEDIKELFSDIRTDTGDIVNDGTFYRQKKNKGDYTAITQPPRKRRYAEIR